MKRFRILAALAVMLLAGWSVALSQPAATEPSVTPEAVKSIAAPPPPGRSSDSAISREELDRAVVEGAAGTVSAAYAEWAAAVAAWVALIISGIAVWLVVHQLGLARADAKKANLRMYAELFGHNLAVQKLLIDDPKLSRIFYGDAQGQPCTIESVLQDERDPAAREALRLKLRVLVELVLDFYDAVAHLRPVIDQHTFDAYRSFIRHVYSRCDYMQHLLQAHPEWYTEEVKSMIGLTHAANKEAGKISPDPKGPPESA